MQRLSRIQIKEAQKSFKHLNAYIAIGESVPQSNDTSDGPLQGLEIAVKDNICTVDLPTTCGSKGLQGYASPYDATVVRLLRQSGASITGKTNLDEFGMGSHSLFSASGPVTSQFGSRSAGGSSGGSAVAVASKQCHAALGTDTGGSVRLPASFNGVYGFKPSYGRLSRWGVVAYANSLDTVGIISDDLPTVRLIFNELDVYDEKDPTSLLETTRERIKSVTQTTLHNSGLRFGIPDQFRIDELSPVVRRAWLKTLTYLQTLGHTIHNISLPRTREALSAYYILAPAEASSNLAKYDGVRYGIPAESDSTHGPLYAATRLQGFGDEVRRRILLGAYSLSADAIDNYFIRAQRIRRLVQDDFNRVLRIENVLTSSSSHSQTTADRVDAIICPTTIDLPPRLGEVEKQSSLETYAGDVLTVPTSLCGLPTLTVPVGIDDPPPQYDGINSVGMQIITQFGDDTTALAIGQLLQPIRNSALNGS